MRLRGENGLTLAIRIRETLGIPVVMLTGRGDEMDKIIVCLDVRGPDWPIAWRELLELLDDRGAVSVAKEKLGRDFIGMSTRLRTLADEIHVPDAGLRHLL